MKIWNWFKSLFLPRMCPSGLGHRIKIGIVKDSLGGEWCWHEDCLDACIKRMFNYDLRYEHIEVEDKEGL